MAAEKIAETVPELKQRIEAYRTKCTDSVRMRPSAAGLVGIAGYATHGCWCCVAQEVALVERAAEIKDLQAEIAKLQSDCAQLRRRLSEHEARGDVRSSAEGHRRNTREG